MQNIEEILKSNGVELSEEQKKAIHKAVTENYKTVSEHEKKVKALEAERDNFKDQLEAANATLSKFDGKDVEGMQKKIEQYEADMEEQREKFEKDIYDRDFSDALNTSIGQYKFTSEYAKQAVMSEIKAAGLKLVDGKIIGLNDMIETIKGKDASAFVDDKQQALEDKKAKFTSSLQTRKDGEKISPSELMKLKNENPDLDISQYM